MFTEKRDVLVVGAGIVGLAHAYHAVRAGRRVTVLERDARAVGASVRNFGMIWPIGQPVGEVRETALTSRAHWRTLLREAGIWHRECGALHLAYAEDELEVMREFVESASDTATLVSPDRARELSPEIRPEGFRGAMHSTTEMAVDARITVRELAAHLERAYGVEFRFATPVHRIESGLVTTENGSFEADDIFVCLGPDAYTLLGRSVEGLRRCRLQMMRLAPVHSGTDLGPHLCAGLTLSHYANFAGCPSLPAVKERFRRDWPEHVERGIHLLVSQQGDGTITVGDSHEYGDAFAPYRDERTDDLILSYLDTFLPLPRFRVVERWDGFYNTHPTMPWLIDHPLPGVTLVNLFGTGMTLSFGVAERVVAGSAPAVAP
ncbi:TIGR03364 family FAD-dependent oxidoreductase [bacterium]|nr:MAG: TIGR03364 family FAD-dependent oxidoreductase [bacterium]